MSWSSATDEANTLTLAALQPDRECDYNLIFMRKTVPCVLMLFALGARASDLALAGVWKLNVSKSHFTHGDLPKSLILTIEPDGPNGVHYRSKNQLIDGSSGGAEYHAKLDGKDYPVSGTPNYDSVSIERVSARTFHIQMKKAGAVIVDTTYNVSADGQVLTRKGTAQKGSDVNKFDEWFHRQ